MGYVWTPLRHGRYPFYCYVFITILALCSDIECLRRKAVLKPLRKRRNSILAVSLPDRKLCFASVIELDISYVWQLEHSHVHLVRSVSYHSLYILKFIHKVVESTLSVQSRLFKMFPGVIETGNAGLESCYSCCKVMQLLPAINQFVSKQSFLSGE